MDVLLWLELLLFVALLGLSAFFSSSETSLFSLNRVQLERMRREGHQRLALIESLLAAPRRLIVTILIGNELVNVTASMISAAIVINVVGRENSWMNVIIMVPLLLLFGEITPKTLAIRHNVAFAAFQSHYIDLFARFITPLRGVVRGIADFFITRLIGEETSRGNILTEDMMRSLTQAAVGEGALHRKEAEYIRHIFDFGDKIVRDIMTPRSQIFSLPVTTPLREVAEELCRTRRTKVPVYEGDKDSIIGVVLARDVQKHQVESSSAQLRDLLRQPYFVPESKLAAELFLAFRKRNLSIALTADEFGGVTGLVTMEGLLECIFGDLPSGSEQVTSLRLDTLAPNRYRVSGRMTVSQFCEATGAHIDARGATTLGGLLLNEFGEIPAERASIAVGNCHFTVTDVVEQRIDEVTAQVTPLVESDPAQDTSSSHTAGGDEPTGTEKK